MAPPVVDVSPNKLTDVATSPLSRKSPTARRVEAANDHSPAATSRHFPVKAAAEPKVYSPFKTRPGQVPRRIEVERMKRAYISTDINEILEGSGVMKLFRDIELEKAENPPTHNDGLDSLPLYYYDNTEFETRALDEWRRLIRESGGVGLKARAYCVETYERNEKLQVKVTWKSCRVLEYDEVDEKFKLKFQTDIPYVEDPLYGLDRPEGNEDSEILAYERLYICFDAEDPLIYCDRILNALETKKQVYSMIALNLYVDSMPVDNLRPLDSTQVNRILKLAANMDAIRTNTKLDTNSIVQQFNLNHMRTLNRMIFVQLLSQKEDINAMHTIASDPELFSKATEVFPECLPLVSESNVPFTEKLQTFRFNALWSKYEPIRIIRAIQSENYALEGQNYFVIPDNRSFKLDEFQMMMQTSTVALTQMIKETWVQANVQTLRSNLKDVRKGWFNLEETNLEVYKFSKLKKFLCRINFMMEDTLRDLTYTTIYRYCNSVMQFCPEKVTVKSNDDVEVVGGLHPLFTVEIKFLNPTAETKAEFVYSFTPDMIFEALMEPLKQMFEVMKGIMKVERRVMKKLFWSHDPVMHIPHSGEDWVNVARDELQSRIKESLAPMDAYLQTLNDFVALIEIDVKSYAAEAEAKFCPNPETFQLAELCELAEQHAHDSTHVFSALPSFCSLGFVIIDGRSIKTLLSNKHKLIASKLFEVLERKTREYADIIINEFSDMFAKLVITPKNIEEVDLLRQYIATLENRINLQTPLIAKSVTHFALLEAAKWKLPVESMDMNLEVQFWPSRMASEITKVEKNLRVIEFGFKKNMEDEQADFTGEIANLKTDVASLQNLNVLSEAAKNAEKVRRIKKNIAEADEKAKQFNSREVLFNATITEYDEISTLTKAFEPFYDLWNSADMWLNNKETWTFGPFEALDSEAVEQEVSSLLRNLTKSGKAFDKMGLSSVNVIADTIKKEVDEFKPKVPIIVALRNAGMRERHWEELANNLNITFPLKEELTLQSLIDLDLLGSIEKVEKTAEKAAKEFGIETALDKMEAAWEPVILFVEMYKETGTSILKGVDEYMALLDEHITMTQAMAFSAFKGPFEERIDNWNNSLATVSEVIDEWIVLQRNWLYLQPIFDSADIQKQLPQESKRFTTVDKYWRTTMAAAIKQVKAIKFCDDVRLMERFKEGNKLLEMVQKGLSDYLQTKCAGFSRFYFLSNDELLEILSETKDPLRVQPHLRKCFEGIKTVDFQDDLTITGMTSPEGERVPFIKTVDPKNKNIEHWMGELKDAMISGVRNNMVQAVTDYSACPRTEWMQKWAAQCVLNGSQLHWTKEVEAALNEKGNKGCYEYYDQLVKQLADMVILIRGKITKLGRITIGALAVIDVHARDVQQKMADAGVGSVHDFDWMAQMRYYWIQGDYLENTGDLAVTMVSSRRWYGNEYLGNSFRLVITPLTDKCYLTLMGALQMILGGAPAGPAGTGKTETTKDLAKALAKQCNVFNCSDGLDYQAMGKFFKGLASSGAWACFDEFNRINIEVLSVIAQQIIQLQGTIQRGEKRTVFEGTDILVDPEFAVFITMNPGYAGRAELPDNLEALFRPVAMMVPDYALIGEIMLFSYGYMKNRVCAQKMVTTFRLCSEQLSSQDHYDYGMRAVKTVITAAGNLKAASPDENEEALLMRALQDVNIPKFLAPDLPLFAGILTDVFPGIQRPVFDYGPLITSLKESIKERNLQPVQLFIRKNIELYEMICVRHGLMVVGPTGGGKSSNIRVLGDALTKLKEKGIEGERYEKTKILHLNPKSIKMGQLYGAFDENTHEWQDGILCVLIRSCIKQDNSDLKWMLFDGPVDAIWIENMNTVLDDNKKLCLVSGEIISLSEPMTMMFEPEDLAVASPATVSRCGMIYMEPEALGYDVLFQSWLTTLPPVLKPIITAKLQMLFDCYVGSILAHLRRYLVEPLPTVNNCLVHALLNLIDTFTADFYDRDDGREKKTAEEIKDFGNKIESIFIFCTIWSLCCTGNTNSRFMMDAFFRSEMSAKGCKAAIPSQGLIYNYKYVYDEDKWIDWTSSASPYVYDPKLSFSELIIPTADSIGYTYLLDILVRNNKHVLMTGPTGTGKSVNILGHLQTGLPDKYVPITISFSAQTGANQTQDLIDSKCEKRRKGVFGPSAGKQFIVFVDDMNMPMKETYGAQPPIEILRQWFDNSGWYDRKLLEFRKLIDMIFVCACGPPGGGRNQVTARFTRHFNIINYSDISDGSMQLIFETILSNFLSTFDEDVQKLSTGIVRSSISIYNTILDELRPTPATPHYTFNLRDISKVFQGMLMCDRRKVNTPRLLGRLYFHETQRVFGDRLTSDRDKKWLSDSVEKYLSENTELTAETLWGGENAKSDVIYTDFMIVGADNKIYEEIESHEAMQNIIEEYLAEYNAESKQPMQLVMFGDAMLHVVKIARILRQPSGHALLLGVGGSGRQSLTRLATYIAQFRVFQIEISKGYGMNEWRENVKECLLYAGVQNKPIVFLFNDTQIINESMLEDVNGILNTGDVPNLYAPEDMEAIATACKPDCARKRIAPTKLNIFSQFLFRIKNNVHVVLCMSPLGDAFRNRLRKFPSIVNCCTIDWFMEWPDDALQSVAARFIAGANFGFNEDVNSSIITFFKYLHQSIERASKDFLAKMRRHFYVTPTSYLELLSTYDRVLNQKRIEVGTTRDRLKTGVDKLLSTEKAVNELQETLTEMKPKLAQTQIEVDEMIVQITADKAVAAETKAVVEVEEASASKKAAETKAIADDAQRDLDEALPALAEAVQCLKDLKKADIDEVKQFAKPTVNVVKTITAVCIMFEVKPERVNDPDNPGKKINDYFKPAREKLLSNSAQLIDNMKEYDKDNIDSGIIDKIEQFYNDPNFTPAVIEKASKACKAMCMWVRAMYKYHQVTLVVEPKKKLLAEATADLEETMKVLKVAQDKLKESEDKIEMLEANFKEANDKKEQLVKDVEQCEARLDRAVKLMSGLGGERTRWIQTCEDLTKAYDNIVGDALVSAGSVSYLGVFTPDFRHAIVEGWHKELENLKIPHSAGTSLRTTLADPVAIRQWTIFGLPQDAHSVENGIIMSKGRRYPLLIDPQGQANRFIKNMGKDTGMCPNDIDVIKLTDKNFLRTLENGVRFGRWVLLENIGESLDASLEPLLLQQKFKQGGTEMIKIGDSVIPWNDQFRFYMTTKLVNPHYPPEVCVKVSLVNFAITFIGLADQLLGVVVVEEMPEMEEKKNSLVISNARMKKELQELEDLILYMLSNSTGNILDDHKLIETLGTSKVKSNEITAKVKEAEKTEVIIDENRNKYKPVAYRGAVLYFCISDLGNIDPMYQYSLPWYRNLFIQAIRQSEASEDVLQRILHLNDYFTYYLYTNVCRSLFEKHKLLFSFLLTVRILQGDDKIDANEYGFLISGKSMKSDNIPNPAPDWLDGRMWSEFLSLSTLPTFDGLATDITKNIPSWREIYDSVEPHNEETPGVWNKKLNSFQKLCILRAIRADKCPEGIMNYVIEEMGTQFVEPPPFDLLACYKDSSLLTPLVFVLSKGSDPTKAFIEFATKLKMDRKIRMLSLGQGQGPKAVKMIEEASQKGYWVLLQNCHLYVSWLQELERICEGLSVDSMHKDFRLWLTSMPTSAFPVSILQNAVKMTNEPPKGLKANLRNAYFKLSNDKLNITKVPDTYKKLLFGLSFFHAVVQERRVFGPLGWNIPYEFNDTDLDISKGQLELFLDQYDEIPWKVLNFLTSYINYGGRVTDYIDIRTIDVIIKSFFQPALLEPNFRFDNEGIFYSLEFDKEDPYASYLAYIETLPLVASPSVFGMHENAKIASANAETFSMFSICMSLQASDGGGGGAGDREAMIGATAKEINDAITAKGMFDIEAVGMMYPTVYEESMNTVLVQECIRYNKLISIMETTLPLLIKALKGLVVMSSDLEAISNSIALNQVPVLWANSAYPSLKPLKPWVDDLMLRLQMVIDWIDQGIPEVFWISGFYFPQAFLTGSLQNFARKMQYPIDTVSFEFIVKKEKWQNLKKPENGVYIRGLYLEGARYCLEEESVTDSLPKQLYTDLPVLHLHPVQHREPPTSGVYLCPVYKILSRRGVLSTTGHSTNFIMWIELPSNRTDIINNVGKADCEEWIRAGVAAFGSLMY